MASISNDLRARLLAQKKNLTTGLIIKRKDWTAGKLRFLPARTEGGDFAAEYHSFWCDRLKKGATSLRTFGLSCPLADYFDELATASKADRDACYKAVKPSHEWWLACLNMSQQEGDPRIQIFCATQTTYLTIVDRMLDADIGEDVLDLYEGRTAFIKKSGVNKETKWTTDWLDRGPVFDDQARMDKLTELHAAFDTRQRLYRTNKDDYCELYRELTGTSPDESTWAQDGIEDAVTSESESDDRPSAAVGVPSRNAARPAAPVRPAPARPAATAPPRPAAPVRPAATAPTRPAAPVRPAAPARTPAPAPITDAVTTDPNAVVVGATAVFVSEEDGNTVDVTGVVQGFNDDGTVQVLDAVGDTWAVPADELVVVLDDAAEPEPEAEAVPVPVKPTTRKPASKPAKAAPAVQEEAAEPEPVKPAPRKPATASLREQARR